MKLSAHIMLAALFWASAWAQTKEVTVFDERVRISSFVELEYPLAARLKQAQGAVVVRVTLDANGKVTNAIGLSGPESLVAPAIANARLWQFQTTTGPTAVLVYQFLIRGLCQQACRSQFLFTPPNLSTITIGQAVINP